MNLAQKISLVACFVLTFCPVLKGRPQIILQLMHPPRAALQPSASEALRIDALKKLEKFTQQTPQFTARKILKTSLLNNSANLPALGGFLFSYAGYMNFSTNDGFVDFPLKHTPPTKINLLITPDIELTLVEATIVRRIAEKSAVMYAFEQKKDSDKNYFWHVEHMDSAEGENINQLTLVLHTKPSNIFVIEGDFLSKSSTNIILPRSLFVVGTNNNISILLKSLDTARFYEQIKYLSKTSERGEQQIIANE